MLESSTTPFTVKIPVPVLPKFLAIWYGLLSLLVNVKILVPFFLFCAPKESAVVAFIAVKITDCLSSLIDKSYS